MRIWRRTPAIASYDARVLRVVSWRTRALRIVLVTAAVALLGVAAWSMRGRSPDTAGGLVPGSSGILVMDLSLSIGGKDYTTIRQTVRELIRDDVSTGLVIFSDVGYELLPPRTPASELRPLLRYLASRGSRLPANPWSGSFRAGTRISSALELARNALVRDGVRDGSILLVSDLITAPEDVPELVQVLNELRRESIAVRVVPLTPLKAGREIFEGLLGKDAFLTPAQIGGREALRKSAPAELPVEFLLLSGLLLLVLAAHERFAGRLGLPRPREGHA